MIDPKLILSGIKYKTGAISFTGNDQQLIDKFANSMFHLSSRQKCASNSCSTSLPAKKNVRRILCSTSLPAPKICASLCVEFYVPPLFPPKMCVEFYVPPLFPPKMCVEFYVPPLFPRLPGRAVHRPLLTAILQYGN
jgi:hypothetical protein